MVKAGENSTAVGVNSEMRTRRAKSHLRAIMLGGVLASFLVDAPGVMAGPVQFTPKQKAIILSLSPLGPPPRDPTNAVAGNCRAIDFGRNLFFDFRLSPNVNRSCATCHNPDSGWADGRAVINGSGLLRNTPSVWNAAYDRWFFWDGRADSLWSQATGPIEASGELNLGRLDLTYRVVNQPDLRKDYEAIFGPLPPVALKVAGMVGHSKVSQKVLWKRLSPDAQKAATQILVNIGKAIAAFEQTIVSRNSAFDRYVAALRASKKGAAKIISPAAQRGLKIFVGRGQCFSCHSGPDFTDHKFHNMLVADAENTPSDPGRLQGVRLLAKSQLRRSGPFSSQPSAGRDRPLPAATPSMRGQFKTPSLRNVTEMQAFMHNGQLLSLRDVIAHYATVRHRASGNPNADPILHRIDITRADTGDLVAFLQSLKDTSELDWIWNDCAAPSHRSIKISDYGQ